MNRKPIGLSIPHRKKEPHWSKLISGVRVEGDTVIIKVKSNDDARFVCGELLREKGV